MATTRSQRLKVEKEERRKILVAFKEDHSGGPRVGRLGYRS
jgi:hypothetical protein